MRVVEDVVSVLAIVHPGTLQTRHFVACCDLCNKMPRLQGSWMDDCAKDGDVFDDAHDNTHWRVTVDHALKIGLGTDQYELVKLDK